MRRRGDYPSPGGMSIPRPICPQTATLAGFIPLNPHDDFLTRVFAISTLLRGSRPPKIRNPGSKTGNEAQKTSRAGFQAEKQPQKWNFRPENPSRRDGGPYDVDLGALSLRGLGGANYPGSGSFSIWSSCGRACTFMISCCHGQATDDPRRTG